MRVGFDIGGTFTDVILLGRDRGLRSAKFLSLLDRVGDDILDLAREGAAGDPVEVYVHGTTQASNAVLENQTAKTGLLTTRGFRDDLEMRTLRRPSVYDLEWDRLPPLIPRHLRLEVNERLRSDGSVDQPLDEEQARGAIRQLLAEGVEAIAVCLLHSYLNPEHEQALRRLVAEAAPQLPVCVSSEIHPEIREYERASTTAINASLVPVIERYLRGLEAKLAPGGQRLLVMQSNGGIMSAELARRKPVRMIESGPAAGVLAAARLCGELRVQRALSLDMGGTTAKACLIENYAPFEKPGGEIGHGANVASRSFTGAGHAIRVPSVDLVEVGAGGGSIAWIDAGGLLRVGPRSAGAQPGPACYGRGGSEPTVTDANLVLGYLNPRSIAGATLAVNREAAIEAIERRLARPLQRRVDEVAYAIVQVADSAMMRAVRAVSTDRGRDPRDFTLIAFGGAGPMHAAQLAASMRIGRVIVPMHPGLFSALGLLLADYRQDHIFSLAQDLEQIDPARVREEFRRLQSAAAEELARQGVAQARVRFEMQTDLKYTYQSAELTLPFDPAEDTGDLRTLLARRFTEAHQRVYDYCLPGEPIELVSLRLRAIAPSGDVKFSDLVQPERGARASEAPQMRTAYFGPQHGFRPARLLARPDIRSAQPGPILFDEPDTTIVVPPQWSVTRDALNNLHMTWNKENEDG